MKCAKQCLHQSGHSPSCKLRTEFAPIIAQVPGKRLPLYPRVMLIFQTLTVGQKSCILHKLFETAVMEIMDQEPGSALESSS